MLNAFVFFDTFLGGTKDDILKKVQNECSEKRNTAESEPIDPLKALLSIINGQSTDDVEASDGADAVKEIETKTTVKHKKGPLNPKCRPYAIVRFQSEASASAALSHFAKIPTQKDGLTKLPSSSSLLSVSFLDIDHQVDHQTQKDIDNIDIDIDIDNHNECSSILDPKDFMSKGCQSKITVVKPTSNEIIQSHCIDQTIEPTGTPRLDPCDLITFHQRNNTHIYRVMKVDRSTNLATLDRPYVQGNYSKRRRSNVAVIIVRIVFISSFLFYCLLCNHSFQTNPNKITNCFKLILSITTLQLHCSCVRYFDF